MASGPAAEPVAGRIACVSGFTALFGLGETVLAPTMAPLVNSLAADRSGAGPTRWPGFGQSLALIVSPARLGRPPAVLPVNLPVKPHGLDPVPGLL
jgi:hypothetical protein